MTNRCTSKRLWFVADLLAFPLLYLTWVDRAEHLTTTYVVTVGYIVVGIAALIQGRRERKKREAEEAAEEDFDALSRLELQNYMHGRPEKFREILLSVVTRPGVLRLALDVASEVEGFEPEIEKLLKHAHPAVREAAIYALERRGARADVFLQVLNEERVKFVADAAKEALANLDAK